MIKSAFENASIMEAVDNKEIPDEDPFMHLFEQKHFIRKETT